MPSIKDVAALAGVGVGTVSRVINNVKNVRPQTKEKVQKAIKELNYIPNEIARNFKMNQSKMIALLLPSIWNPFFSQLAYYIEDELDKVGFKLMLCNSGGKPEKELYYFDMLKQNQVAGIVGITYNDIDAAVTGDIPMVSIDRHFKSNITCVTSDNFNGGRMALKELIKAGSKKPAFIGEIPTVQAETINRKLGFIEEAKTQGIDYVIFEAVDQIVDEEAFLDNFIKQHKDIDGVFAMTDMLAAMYIERAKFYNIKTPEDVKVIGYDGIQDHKYFHPILSTIKQPIKEMAEVSVNLLMKKIAGEPREKDIYHLPATFYQGETT